MTASSSSASNTETEFDKRYTIEPMTFDDADEVIVFLRTFFFKVYDWLLEILVDSISTEITNNVYTYAGRATQSIARFGRLSRTGTVDREESQV